MISDTEVICKVVDVIRYPDSGDLLVDAATAYAVFQNLQGKVIPRIYGFYEVWGILQLLDLEDVGDAIAENETIDQTLRMQIRAPLQYIQYAGYVHGDIARRGFCREAGQVFLVDLEHCQLSVTANDQADERNEVDRS